MMAAEAAVICRSKATLSYCAGVGLSSVIEERHFLFLHIYPNGSAYNGRQGRGTASGNAQGKGFGS